MGKAYDEVHAQVKASPERWVASGNRDLVQKYNLKKRKYIGNTSMDAELSLIMANQAL
ncbi:18123_t:CDS:2, partial [Racocetra fulgida]